MGRTKGWKPPSGNQGSPPPPGTTVPPPTATGGDSGGASVGVPGGLGYPGTVPEGNNQAPGAAVNAALTAEQQLAASTLVSNITTSAGSIAQALEAGRGAEAVRAATLQGQLQHAPIDTTDYLGRAGLLDQRQTEAEAAGLAQEGLSQTQRDQIAQELLAAGVDKDQIDTELNRIDVRERGKALEKAGLDIQDRGINDAIALVTSRLDDVAYDEAAFNRDIDGLNDRIASVARQREEIGLELGDLAGLQAIGDALQASRQALLTIQREGVAETQRIGLAQTGLGREGLTAEEAYATAEETAAGELGRISGERIESARGGLGEEATFAGAQETASLEEGRLSGERLGLGREGLAAEAAFAGAEETAAGEVGRVQAERLGLAGEGLTAEEAYAEAQRTAAGEAGRIGGERIGLAEEELGLQLGEIGTTEERIGLASEGIGLAGEEIGFGEQDIETQREQIRLQEESTGRQAQRARGKLGAEAAGRGASFTTGLRSDVGDIRLAEQAALDQLGLQRQLLDTQSGRSGLQRQGLGLEQRELGLQTGEAALERQRVGLGQEGLGLSREELASQQALEEAGFTLGEEERRLTGSEIGLSGEELAARRGLETAGLDLGAEQRRLAGDEIGLAEEELAAQQALQAAGFDYGAEQRARAGGELGLSEQELAAQQGLQAAGFDLGAEQRRLAGDELGLQDDATRMAAEQATAGLDFEEAQQAAAEEQRAIAYDQNVRALGLQDADMEDLSAQLGADVDTTRDAISRLDTDRLGFQTEINNLARDLEASGLARDAIDLELESMGYDRDDMQLRKDAIAIQEEVLSIRGEAVDYQDALIQANVQKELIGIEGERTGLGEQQAASEQRQAEFEADYGDSGIYNQWLADQTQAYSVQAGLAGQQAALGALPMAMEAGQQIASGDVSVGSDIYDMIGGTYENATQLGVGDWNEGIAYAPESDLADQTIPIDEAFHPGMQMTQADWDAWAQTEEGIAFTDRMAGNTTVGR